MVHLESQLRTVVNPDGAAILDIPRNQITTLNSTGGFVWERLQRGFSIEQVIQDLSVEANADPTIVERDVNAFLAQLRSKQLL